MSCEQDCDHEVLVGIRRLGLKMLRCGQIIIFQHTPTIVGLVGRGLAAESPKLMFIPRPPAVGIAKHFLPECGVQIFMLLVRAFLQGPALVPETAAQERLGSLIFPKGSSSELCPVVREQEYERRTGTRRTINECRRI